MAEEIKITEWLQKAKENPKEGAIPIVAFLCLGFIVYKFLYAPKALLLTKELKKNKAVQVEMKKFQNAANQLEDIKIDIEDKKKELNNIQKLCYKELERTQFLRRIRELAQQANLNIKSINPMPDQNLSIGPITAKKFSVNFNYLDNLHKLLTFMRLVELEEKICFMPVPSLSSSASGTFDTTVTVSTILLPDVLNINPTTDDEDEDEYEDE